MSTRDRPTVFEMLRANPIRGGLFAVLPVVVAAVQLLNSYVNDLPFLVSIPFAVVMVAFAGLLLSYHLAKFRVTRLETEAVASASD